MALRIRGCRFRSVNDKWFFLSIRTSWGASSGSRGLKGIEYRGHRILKLAAAGLTASAILPEAGTI
jgi:hypothetical protein